MFKESSDMKKLNFDYHEPSWDWIKKFLSENKVNDFVNSSELWGDVPQKCFNFRKILNKRISELSKIYL